GARASFQGQQGSGSAGPSCRPPSKRQRRAREGGSRVSGAGGSYPPLLLLIQACRAISSSASSITPWLATTRRRLFASRLSRPRRVIDRDRPLPAVNRNMVLCGLAQV